MNILDLLHQAYTNIIPFTILLGILIFVHELGHFVVARMCGVRVEVFSLGFGKKILSYKKGDTTYCLSLIPLGGYVKMFGEQNGDVVSESEKSVSFTHKTVWQRIAIVLAGPLMNFFFAVFVFSFVSAIGEETRAPVLAEIEQNSAAATMGLKAGDRVTQINSENIQSYEDLQKALNKNQNSSVKATLTEASGEKKELTLTVGSTKNPNIFSTEKTIGEVAGIQSLARGTVVGVNWGSPAEKAGFKPGDEIIEINGQKVSKWFDLEKMVSSAATLNFTVERGTDSQKTKANVSIAAIPAGSTLESLGFEQPDLFLDLVVKDSPAEKADLRRYGGIL